ncbi:Hypothetical protein R9X50_00396900 [Acrodontium crateriforme]|uniref:Uncharacterized protein n=1 Tax=Acrodontium crateriforme TaxID=150365 RepID=A0AAQ3M4F3_9PEZI|nr:Hypothetical protein R9X50_00396900 [Acrodontium crateriforme]
MYISAALGQKKPTAIQITTRPRSSSDDSSKLSLKAPSLKSPRTARFAEATTVYSPIEPSKTGRSPFADPPETKHYMPQPQPSDIGFGYVNRHESVEMPDTDNNEYPKMPLRSPGILKSAMKTPGAPPRDFGNILSPTFKEDEILEKHEAHTDKIQAKDLKVKTRVRMAKMMLRGVNFSCSLIVLSMLSTTFSIFNATKTIPPRNNLPPWALGQKIWPQVTLLVISCISLFASLIIFYAYWKGGHNRAEKAAVYYTSFAVAFFVFSIVMWGIGAGILQQSKTNGNNKDMWGWSCVNNARHSLFETEVQYNLICRLQNWSLLCCIIEVVVETITIAIYGVVFYRFYSKRQLRKSMAARDRARSDLYLAQLRSQSAPNTPGLNGPLSPRDGGWKAPVDYYSSAPTVEEGEVQYIDPVAQKAQPRPFQLQPVPVKGLTPKLQQVGFTPVTVTTRERSPTPPELNPRSPLMSEVPREQVQEHFAPAPGEQVYEEVPIPGAYEAPLSPGARPAQTNFPYYR